MTRVDTALDTQQHIFESFRTYMTLHDNLLHRAELILWEDAGFQISRNLLGDLEYGFLHTITSKAMQIEETLGNTFTYSYQSLIRTLQAAYLTINSVDTQYAELGEKLTFKDEESNIAFLPKKDLNKAEQELYSQVPGVLHNLALWYGTTQCLKTTGQNLIDALMKEMEVLQQQGRLPIIEAAIQFLISTHRMLQTRGLGDRE